MSKLEEIRERHAAYASRAVDIRYPVVLEDGGRPVAVILPYAEYQRLAALQRQMKADWRTCFRELLTEVHAQTASFSPEEIATDIRKCLEHP